MEEIYIRVLFFFFVHTVWDVGSYFPDHQGSLQWKLGL